MFIETERTPNPATLMFRPGRSVTDGATADFATPEAAEASPLAAALFGLGDVSGVFFAPDFISVTKAEGSADWASLKTQVLGVLVDHFSSGAPLFSAAASTGPAIDDDPEDAEIVSQIVELIDTRIRPQVAGDGGDIVYRGFNKGTVFLEMQGACAGCPSSTATLKMGIESLLKYYVPEVTDVRAV
ncbi:NifU family protein [Polymorphobacter fuscus]|uniref:NifU family protein n=1 Tax=Sandarakinorhabdus fusca TaxID=1439888 RepID=A0A7C9GYM5_9SPHN|nr:NifU family protein [Polymorphobacter fuscus]KAB7645604.1 NifU family protein [Polymorphobacter fuscus]MQT18054.1 NifU family protein [Polymorphobacter fuscus]NJC08687.1 Fe-S cluster biogenesis protein NfuA [Polymorphobacter fuscus]